MKALYYGTTEEFNIIDASRCKGYKDFDRGFYATARKDHAESIAKRNKRIKIARQNTIERRNHNYRKATFNAYRYNLIFSENTDGLNVKIFKTADVEWARFILMNRKSEYTRHNYDVVIGPTADDETTTIINYYEPMLIKYKYSDEILKQLISELSTENLPKQYFFANKKAMDTLKFDEITREILV